MASNCFSSGLPNRRDHPPPLGKTSKHDLTVRPPNVTFPHQRPSENTRLPSAIRKIFDDGVRTPNVRCSDGNFWLQMEFTSAPSSKRPSTLVGVPFTPFSSTVCINGRVINSESFHPIAYRLTHGFIGNWEGT